MENKSRLMLKNPNLIILMDSLILSECFKTFWFKTFQSSFGGTS